MGVVGEPILSSSSEVCRMYEDLMDQHGNTLALQYAGSQLVHSIKTYKKISVIQVCILILIIICIIFERKFCMVDETHMHGNSEFPNFKPANQTGPA